MNISDLNHEIGKFLTPNSIVDKNDLDNFLCRNNINIRDDYRQLIVRYGNCKEILRNGFSDFTYEKMKSYYLESNDIYDDKVPCNTMFIGTDFDDEPLCIDYYTGEIYTYFEETKDLFYYRNIDDLFFYCFMNSIYLNIIFNNIQNDIKVYNPKNFLVNKEGFKITEIKNHIYYFIDFKIYKVYNHIYESDNSYLVADIFEGGVLENYQSIII